MESWLILYHNSTVSLTQSKQSKTKQSKQLVCTHSQSHELQQIYKETSQLIFFFPTGNNPKEICPL